VCDCVRFIRSTKTRSSCFPAHTTVRMSRAPSALSGKHDSFPRKTEIEICCFNAFLMRARREIIRPGQPVGRGTFPGSEVAIIIVLVGRHERSVLQECDEAIPMVSVAAPVAGPDSKKPLSATFWGLELKT